jgi:DnaA family protein
MRQLPLGVRLRDAAAFASYHGGPNEAALDYVRTLATGGASAGAWLWGRPGVGKTHLLQAACRAADEAGRAAIYLPLGSLARHGAAPLQDLGGQGLVAVDELDAAAGRAELERGLFALYNDLQDAGGQLLIASAADPATLPVTLPDLRSRLAACVVYPLRQLDENDTVAALKLRAAHRGLELPDETVRYLMRRLPRDIASLCRWLDRLDDASLAAQRRLTVPFVSRVLGESTAPAKRP